MLFIRTHTTSSQAVKTSCMFGIITRPTGKTPAWRKREEREREMWEWCMWGAPIENLIRQRQVSGTLRRRKHRGFSGEMVGERCQRHAAEREERERAEGHREDCVRRERGSVSRKETGGTKLSGERKCIKGWGRKRQGGRE